MDIRDARRITPDLSKWVVFYCRSCVSMDADGGIEQAAEQVSDDGLSGWNLPKD